jgi:hypothetical protein
MQGTKTCLAFVVFIWGYSFTSKVNYKWKQTYNVSVKLQLHISREKIRFDLKHQNKD